MIYFLIYLQKMGTTFAKDDLYVYLFDEIKILLKNIHVINKQAIFTTRIVQVS